MLVLDSKTLLSTLQKQISNLTTAIWYTLRSPKTTAVLLIILALVGGVGLLIPQPAGPFVSDAAREAWIDSLPLIIQPAGQLLFSLGFAHLLNSLWFWLPLGLLLLNSLVALADYGPGSWQRLQATAPSLNWQHPLAQRAEQSTRLPESPALFLDELKTTLTAQGFYLYTSPEAETRLLGAAQRRWAWLGPLVFYGALIVIIAALIVSHYFLEIDTLTLGPGEPLVSRLFSGKFELVEVEPNGRVGHVTYTLDKAASDHLAWGLYMPTIFEGAIIWPRAIEPILTVETRDKNGDLLRLIPSQENLFPSERLHLSLSSTNTPVYFLIPATNLAFQIVPNALTPAQFEVKVRRGSELTPMKQINVQAGKAFDIEGVTVSLTLNSNITTTIVRDPALPLYLVGLGFIIVAGIFTFWQPPLQVWFIPEVKGRGGQLYGVIEMFGRTPQFPQFLEDLLGKEA